jgi:hypothetical protein
MVMVEFEPSSIKRMETWKELIGAGGASSAMTGRELEHKFDFLR